MPSWTILTAATDRPDDFTAYCLDERADSPDTTSEHGTTESGNPYVAFIGTVDPGDIELTEVADGVHQGEVNARHEFASDGRSIAQNCPIACEWIAVVQNNTTQPDEHLWLYLPTNPVTERDQFDTPYVCLDSYHERIGEYFLSQDDWEAGKPATSAAEFATHTYGIEVMTRPAWENGRD